MTDDQLFRYILLAGFVIVLPIAIYHRARAHTGEKLDRRHEGWLLVPIRLVGFVAMIALLVLVIANPRWMAWSSMPLPVWLRWVGVGLGALTALLLTWTFHTLGKNITDTVVTRKEHSLVTSGPYRFVRHPFYVSLLLAVISNSLVAANWLVLGAGIAVFVMLALRSRKEEEKLVERFGDAYRGYREQTGAFFPRLYK